MNVLHGLYDVAVHRWLWRLFRHGPFFLGFWKGLADADICARLAGNSEASDWRVEGAAAGVTPACTAMIHREYASVEVLVVTGLYMVTVAVLSHTALRALLASSWRRAQ